MKSSPTIIAAAPGEHPVLSGGMEIAGWRKAKRVSNLPGFVRGKIWIADAPSISGRTLEFRQLWVNGHKAIRARDTERRETWNGSSLGRNQPERNHSRTAMLVGIKQPANMEMVVDRAGKSPCCGWRRFAEPGAQTPSRSSGKPEG